MEHKLCIITNEQLHESNGNFFCDNIDLKSIPEGLKEFADIKIVGRKSKKSRTKQINVKQIESSSNLIGYIYLLIKSFKFKETKYLIISISPFTFFASLILKIFSKKHFIYLRSNGYEEYKNIIGGFGTLIYHFMFIISVINASLISCRKRFLRNHKGEVVHPSQINEKWFLPEKKIDLKKKEILYVGRIRVEKGVYSLMDILKDTDIKLTIVTSEKDIKIKNLPKNVSAISFENKDDAIIKFYDDHSIFILPSFTEGHPQVLDEALARARPVIIFTEIEHVKRDRKGVFVSERNLASLLLTIKQIKENYEKIVIDIKNNKLPTKKNFLLELKKIINLS